MPIKVPTALVSRQCQGSDRDTQNRCVRQAEWVIDLMKGDESYWVCQTHADDIAHFEREKDWIEYARHDERRKVVFER